MPQAPDRYQPIQPGMGYSAEEPNHFWKALEGVVNGLRAMPMSNSGQRPWGMNHEPTLTASQSVGPAASGAMDTMSDPRNAWMGLGPAAGVVRMGQGMRGAGQAMKDMGGFNAATSDMRQAMGMPRPNTRVGASGNEGDVRKAYMGTVDGGNMISNILSDLDHPQYQQLAERYQSASSGDKEVLNKIMSGMDKLNAASRPNAVDGGGVVPPWKYGQ